MELLERDIRATGFPGELWVRWAYGAGFDRDVARNAPAAWLKVEDVRFVVDELVQYVVARA